MKFERFSLPIRIVIALVILFWMLRFMFSGRTGEMDAGTKIVGLLMFTVYGLILFVLFGFPFIRRVAEKFGTLYEPHDKHFRIMPEYSAAEARVKTGRYAEAVEEYRKVIAQHPDDIYAHIRIAELALAHWQNVRLAELELMSATAKAASEDGKVLAAGKLADLYHEHLHDTVRAIAVLRDLQAKLPDSKAAQRAAERIAILEQAAAGNTAPPPPKKIAFRAADEETIRRRRGY